MSNGSPTQGITTRTYKPGSIVYFENDKSENIYILKSGLIILTSQKLETGEEVKEEVRPGEFFGVKSALGRYPREETAQVIKESVVLVLTLADFERLILKNVNVVLKMLRIFSNQLRRIGRAVREVLGETSTINPEEELFKIGEYYYRAGRFNQARYAYNKYLDYYPNAKYSDLATKRIREIDSGQAESNIAPQPVKRKEVEPSTEELKDFTLDEDIDSMPAKESVVDEMDDFLGENDSASSDFDIADESPKHEDISSMFYDAMSLYSQSEYESALQIYKKILNQKSLKNDAENKIYQKAHFEIGRTFFKMGQYNEAIEAFSLLMKKFPQSELNVNALYHLAMIYEVKKQFDKAKSYYQKVISLAAKEEIGKQASRRLKNLESR
ncbi:MAG TPA: tetratricopeptide repeat protein [Spirochaetota bacterium]|mgnify:FL=1|nr:tetratricopeptide repeat protein [Spirochaetota bacterium]HOM08708.1 tetratricopeptide repeat protein [Spirochaetota bacterium]HPP48502.1 tetratricopeptide repeat protein [Spirochaetota bacterium]HXK64869.1 tetratricopeptide repeat protein [Spirochaetota bacterium]